MTCTGTTIDQGAGAPGSSASNIGYSTRVETGVTVNVASGVNPFLAGRGEGAAAGGGATGYADGEALAYASNKRNPNHALAAIHTTAPPVVPFQQRWSVWAAGFAARRPLMAIP